MKFKTGTKKPRAQKCAMLFCPHPKEVTVKLDVKGPQYSYVTNRVCLTHAQEILNKTKKDGE